MKFNMPYIYNFFLLSVIFPVLVIDLLLCVTELVTSSLLLRGILKVRDLLYKPSYGFCDVSKWEEGMK
jgi:hypothetical protein